MTTSTRRRTRSTVLASLAILSAVLVADLGYQSFAARSSSATPQSDTRTGNARGIADGRVPNGATVFDDVPGVAKLDEDLRTALRRAATDAGIGFPVNSGWRSRAYQEGLLDDAIAKYGSRSEATRWVATPDTSLHVGGRAVDIGGTEAQAWLSTHGAAYGLCQIYDNEPWHYELRPEAAGTGCPPRYADPTHDPRMRR
ncbi:M15 family metallopeptidase [Aeromicrobium ginsengisoli]|uniref:M15 family metallopeptidase n=1 Tax=Aeromicrobium ginsengisoli TaxID=363867 RepID=A0A5M4FH78_9ACTN|nr:M15 family metallopeptidase [Aeromicrobium ginsengisoli]KAA1399401.1 M15 family metallopeptidase [Aeromicrobium ginsengisoli]